MSLRGKIRKFAHRLTGTHIYRTAPRGVDFAQDIRMTLPRFRASVVFDVGANAGQSAILFLRTFPAASIYSFEPATDTFHELVANVRKHDRVRCHQLAFGSSSSEGQMVFQGKSHLSFVVGQSSQVPGEDARSETVKVTTLDEFCRANALDRISFLKIDTEGADLEVLRGAVTLLAERRVDVIQVEAGMSPTNSRHVPFETIKSFLESYGYCLFGIYEQVSEWSTGKPHLRRTNPIFISPQVMAENSKSA
jgi:FkbM family methyltransferase